MAIIITPEQVAPFIRGSSVKIKKAALDGLRKGCALGIAVVVKQMHSNKPHPPVDRGTMARSWKKKNIKHGAAIYNTAKHAPIIEHGSRPFLPPYTPIARWVARKMKLPQTYVKAAKAIMKGGKPRRRTGPATRGHSKMRRRRRGENRRKQVVRFLAVVQGTRGRIRARGIQGRNILGKSEPVLTILVMAEIRRAITGITV